LCSITQKPTGLPLGLVELYEGSRTNALSTNSSSCPLATFFTLNEDVVLDLLPISCGYLHGKEIATAAIVTRLIRRQRLDELKQPK
jgi:hypothetical protein